MTACIDLALGMVDADLGPEVARNVAKRDVVNHLRSGGQSQLSAMQEVQPSSDRIQKALAYANAHLRDDLSVESLAAVAGFSPR